MLILLFGLHFASIALLAEGKIQVVTVITDPIALTWKGAGYGAIIVVFGWGGIASHFEFYGF